MIQRLMFMVLATAVLTTGCAGRTTRTEAPPAPAKDAPAEGALPAAGPSAESAAGAGATAAPTVASESATVTPKATGTDGTKAGAAPSPESATSEETQVILLPAPKPGAVNATAAPETEPTGEAKAPVRKGKGKEKTVAAKGKAAPGQAVAASGTLAKRVAPETSLSWLKHGNTRFVKGWLRKDGQAKKDIHRVSEKQAPHAIVLACSDSRVPPELIFDQKLGELVVVRTAAENPDESAIAAIEHAVETLGTRLLVVLGHSSCGFVNAAVKTAGGGDAGSPALNHVLEQVRPRLNESRAKETGGDGAASALANAKAVAHELMERSAIIKGAVENGRLQIQSAMYAMDKGTVTFE